MVSAFLKSFKQIRQIYTNFVLKNKTNNISILILY